MWNLTRIWFASSTVDVFVTPGGPSIWIIRRRRCQHQVQVCNFPFCRLVFFQIGTIFLLVRLIPGLVQLLPAPPPATPVPPLSDVAAPSQVTADSLIQLATPVRPSSRRYPVCLVPYRQAASSRLPCLLVPAVFASGSSVVFYLGCRCRIE